MKKLIVIVNLVILSILLVSCSSGSKSATNPIYDIGSGFLNKNAEDWAANLSGKTFTILSKTKSDTTNFTDKGIFPEQAYNFLDDAVGNYASGIFLDKNNEEIDVEKRIVSRIVKADSSNQVIMMEREYLVNKKTGVEIQRYALTVDSQNSKAIYQETDSPEGVDGSAIVSPGEHKYYYGYELSSDGAFLFQAIADVSGFGIAFSTLESVKFEKKILYAFSDNNMKNITQLSWLYTYISNPDNKNVFMSKSDNDTFKYEELDIYPFLTIGNNIGIIDSDLSIVWDRVPKPKSYEETKEYAFNSSWNGTFDSSKSGVIKNANNYKYLIFTKNNYNEYQWGYFDITLGDDKNTTYITLNEFKPYGGIEQVYKVNKTLERVTK